MRHPSFVIRQSATRVCLRLIVPALLVAALAPAPAPARIIGRSAEISIGREAASAVEQFFIVDSDPVAVARVRQIGRRLAASAHDPDFPFEFHVVESPEVNAFALPGGFIYVFRGLLQLVPNDDALASVLAHEISHVTRRHSIKQFEKNLLLSAGISAVLSGTGASGFRDVRQVVEALAGLSFSRKDESDADDHGIRVLTKAGYNPLSAVEAMELVKRASGDNGSIPALLRSHPAPDSRIRKLTELANTLRRERESSKPAPETLPAPPPAAAVRKLAGLEGVQPAAYEWFPLVPGAQWSYHFTEGKTALRTSVRVLEELDAEPRGVYRVEYVLGRGIRTVRLLATARDRVLSRAERGDGAWKVDALFTSASDPNRMRIAGEETVRVPAGEFQAVRVEQRSAEGAVEAVLWFARGVGLVRRHSPAAGTAQELVSYHLPAMTNLPEMTNSQ